MHNRILSILIAAACIAPPVQADEPKPATMLGTEAGQVRDDNGLTMKLVWCPPGIVTMEQHERERGVVEVDGTILIGAMVVGVKPVRVFLSRGYWLGKYEITRGEWKQVISSEPWKDDREVNVDDTVSADWIAWDQAMEFCRRITERERGAGRLAEEWEYTLPTEAQWERACRARTESRFNFGDDESALGEYAWFFENSRGHNGLHRVGEKKPNPWGLHDMHGNVFEWCRDYFVEKLPGGRDPEVRIAARETRIKGTALRVIRGGRTSSSSSDCQSGSRAAAGENGDAGLGFRVALTPVRPAAENQGK